MTRLKKVVLMGFFLSILLTLVVFPPFMTKLIKMEVVVDFPKAASNAMDYIQGAVCRFGLNMSRFRSKLSNTQLEKMMMEHLESNGRGDSERTTHQQSKQKNRPTLPTKANNSEIESTVSVSVSPRNLTRPVAHVQLFNRTVLTYGDIPQVRVQAVNCAKLIERDPNEQTKAALYQKEHPKVIIPDEQIYTEALNCSKFLSDRRYIRKPASEEENNFPLAFSILLFKNVELFERLLRAIYRPQNFYCVHVDKKSPKSVQDAVGAVVKCFENVFMAPEQFDVQWGTFSVLEPELSCMSELLKYKKWKYFINLTGQEFPLKTNWEIVQILKCFNGSNNLEGTIKRRNPKRIINIQPAPFNIRVIKGSVHITATRDYVQYIVYNKISIKFREWVKHTVVPDETYFSTLNFNPHLQVPGSYLGIPETDTEKNLFITRFKNWGDGPFNWPCGGKRVRGVCIFSVSDLPLLASRVELFANKFHIDYEPLALDCLEELHYNRTRKEISSGPRINRTFYEDLDFVRNHI